MARASMSKGAAGSLSACCTPTCPRLCHAGMAVLDLLILAGFMVLILGSGVFATNIYCRFAYNWCESCGSMNAKRRDTCRKCGARIH